MPRHLRLIVAALSWLIAQSALAQLPSEDNETAQGIALGSGVRAAAASTTALAYNPAALATGSVYHLEAFGGYDSRPGHWDVGSAVADSTVRWAAAGFSFRGILGGDDPDYKGMDAKLGIGVPLLEMLSVGLSGRFLKLRPEEGSNPRIHVRRFTMDTSILLRPAEMLSVAFLANNIVKTDSPAAPLTLGGSVALDIADVLMLGGDLLVDLTTYEEIDKTALRAGGGAEVRISDVRLRAGYYYLQVPDDPGFHAVTGGAGYVSRQFGIEIGVRHFVQPHAATEGILSLRYFVR